MVFCRIQRTGWKGKRLSPYARYESSKLGPEHFLAKSLAKAQTGRVHFPVATLWPATSMILSLTIPSIIYAG